MLVHVPRLVSIEVGTSAASLCAEELLQVVNEVAELTVGTLRLILRDRHAIDTLLRVADHAQYRGVDTILSLPRADEQTLRATLEISPAAVALPLQAHYEELHDSIAPFSCTWCETAAFAAIARHAGVAVELETEVVPANADDLVSIASVARALHAGRWRVDFSVVKPSPTAAATILGIADHGTLPMTVHSLPQLRTALLRQMTSTFRVPDLRKLSSIDRSESVHIAHDGVVLIHRRANEIAGSVRRQTIAAVFNGSPSYLRLRASDDPQRPIAAPPQLARRSRFSTSMARG
jgi:hypothetical protein